MADRLPDDVLARRNRLPVKPEPVVLAGRLVELRPLELDRDVLALHAVSSGAPFVLGTKAMHGYDSDERIWRYMSGGPFADAAALRAWLAVQDGAIDGRPFTVLDRAIGTPVGVVNLIANQPQHLKIELGAIWYGPIAQRTGASREVTYLLLEHVFGLGYRRAEWKCDARNEPSRRAALSYGFTFEGIQEAHYINKGENRDTAWFRMLDREWPRIRQAAAARIGTPTM
ncbi:MAG: putative acetyltransferase [Myxococcales bacterium]|nr:putative acetyltransferase [Myxococcales bacterium]